MSVLSSAISHALRFIADPSKRLIDMITPPTATIDTDAFSPPVEQGTVAVPRAPEVHFQTFVKVLVAVESKGSFSQGRRDLLIDEWQKMSKTLSAYMNTLLPRQQKVRERVIFAANRDVNDFVGLFFFAAFPNSVPPESVCCLHIKPFFLLNDNSTPSVRADSSSKRDTNSVVRL